MLHHMRAEYGDEGLSGPVRRWHMVPTVTGNALCGQDVPVGGPILEPTEWGRTKEPCCRACGVLWLQSVPFLADEHDRQDYLS
ncbi:hypothetical protein [Kitasatospora mediocidica]|uniref:hypothetical protein n=1 Tax=Kitasatospora mediocidica TaxID=58352 RepID=UPI00056D586C|nr:hypothetical protein [Kitasatospora mediocidica]